MTPQATGCRACHPGRMGGPALLYARELGITKRRLYLLGGYEKLRALSEDARRVLLKPAIYGNSRAVSHGGLAARGMLRGVPGIKSQSASH